MYYNVAITEKRYYTVEVDDELFSDDLEFIRDTIAENYDNYNDIADVICDAFVDKTNNIVKVLRQIDTPDFIECEIDDGVEEI